MRIKKNILENFFIFLYFFILSLIIFRGILFSNGLIVNGDFTVPNIELRDFIKFFYPIWNEQGSYSNLFRLPRILFYAPVFFFSFIFNFSLMDFTKITLILTELIAGLSIYHTLSYILQKNCKNYKKTNLILSSLILSTFYIISPFVIQRSHHIFILLSYAFLPLFLLYIIRTVAEKKYIFVILSAFILSIMCGDVHWVVFGFLLLLSLIILNIILDFSKKSFLKNIIFSIKIILIFLVIFFGFSTFWFLPYINTLGTSASTPTEILTLDTVDMLSQNSYISNIFQFKTYWLDTQSYFPIPEILKFQYLNNFLILANFSIIFFSTISIIFKPKNKYILIFFILNIIFIFLSMGNQDFLLKGKLYQWIIFKVPFHEIYGWVFRDPNKFIQFPILFSSILASFSLLKIYEKINKFNQVKIIIFFITILFLFIIILPAWPIFTGDLNGEYTTTKIPEEYILINKWLDEQESDFKVLWMPNYIKDKSIWNSNRAMDSFLSFSSLKPTYVFTDQPNHFHFFSLSVCPICQSLVSLNKTKFLSRYLDILNVKYLILHDDTLHSNSEIEKILNFLKNQEGLKLKKQEGFLYLFENTNFLNHVSSSDKNIVINGGLDTFNSLNYIPNFNVQNFSIQFSQSKLDFKNIQETDYFIFKNKEFNDLLNFREKKYLFPYIYTDNLNPSKYWSKGAITDYGSWISNLGKRNIYNWDFDYGKGLIFTWAKREVPNDLEIQNLNLIYSWSFDDENQLSEWKENTPEKQFNVIQKLKWENQVLKAELQDSSWGWKTINSPLIPGEYFNYYFLKLKIKGENVSDVHLKIVEYDEKNKIVGEEYIKAIGTGSFNWKDVEIIYTPKSDSMKYLQLQIWHGHETKQVLPNIVWLDNVEVYDITNNTNPVNLKIPFKIDKSDTYKLFIRYFKSQKGGKIAIYLDRRTIQLKTEDQVNKFVWEDLGGFNLLKGKHQLILKNIDGFNAVNLFTLIPIGEYEKLRATTEDILKDKKVIYIFEGESDLYYQEANVSNKYGIESSNGEVLETFNGGSVQQEFEILKEGYYKIGIKLNGNFDLMIDNSIIPVNSDSLAFVYTKPFWLGKGKHTIKLIPRLPEPIIWNFNSEEDKKEWSEFTPENQFGSIYRVLWDKDEKALKTELYSSSWGWKTVNSPLIPANFSQRYRFKFSIKAENGSKIHFKIVELDENKKIIEETYAGGVGEGTFSWEKKYYNHQSKNPSTAYLQLQIWHGHESKQAFPNIVWLDNVEISPFSPADLDVIWIYSTEEDETLEDIFKKGEGPADVMDYKKINSTLWDVKINAKKPFMLSFAESYDSLWEARIYRNGKNIKTIESTPLYSVINGFWIEETGDLEIKIRYKPQDWFDKGIGVSGVIFLSFFSYLGYDWQKKRKKN